MLNWPTAITSLVGGISWVFGIAIAKGFWMTVGAACFPPMAWVLVAERLLERV